MEQLEVSKLPQCPKATLVNGVWFPGTMPIDEVVHLLHQINETRGHRLAHIDALALVYPFLKNYVGILKQVSDGQSMTSNGQYVLQLTKVGQCFVDIEERVDHFD